MKQFDIVEDLGKGLIMEQLAKKGEKPSEQNDRKQKELRPGKSSERSGK